MSDKSKRGILKEQGVGRGYDNFRTSLAGLPATIRNGDTERVTTLQAPTIELEPIETPGNKKARAPINTLSPITIGAVTSGRVSELKLWEPVQR